MSGQAYRRLFDFECDLFVPRVLTVWRMYGRFQGQLWSSQSDRCSVSDHRVRDDDELSSDSDQGSDLVVRGFDRAVQNADQAFDVPGRVLLTNAVKAGLFRLAHVDKFRRRRR